MELNGQEDGGECGCLRPAPPQLCGLVVSATVCVFVNQNSHVKLPKSTLAKMLLICLFGTAEEQQPTSSGARGVGFGPREAPCTWHSLVHIVCRSSFGEGPVVPSVCQ